MKGVTKRLFGDGGIPNQKSGNSEARDRCAAPDLGLHNDGKAPHHDGIVVPTSV